VRSGKIFILNTFSAEVADFATARWRIFAAGRSTGDEMTQAFFVPRGEKVIIVGDSDVIAIHIEWMEGSF
jgi:hypothetical protein